MDRAVKVEKTRLDLATEAEIGRLNTLFCVRGAPHPSHDPEALSNLGMEVMENLKSS
jgi:hypothetical protein